MAWPAPRTGALGTLHDASLADSVRQQLRSVGGPKLKSRIGSDVENGRCPIRQGRDSRPQSGPAKQRHPVLLFGMRVFASVFIFYCSCDGSVPAIGSCRPLKYWPVFSITAPPE
jgi:hypothetical protein